MCGRPFQKGCLQTVSSRLTEWFATGTVVRVRTNYTWFEVRDLQKIIIRYSPSAKEIYEQDTKYTDTVVTQFRMLLYINEERTV